MKKPRPVVALVAERPQLAAYLTLKRLTSATLVRTLLSERADRAGLTVTPQTLTDKAAGVAAAVRSAFGFLDESPGGALNARVLSRYYAMLQLTFAEQVADPATSVTLADVQRHTAQGHGMKTYTLAGPFMGSHLVYLTTSGHFAEYLKYHGVKVSDVALGKSIKTDADMKSVASWETKTISLNDLLRRIPELRAIVQDHLGAPPLSFPAYHDDDDIARRSARGTQPTCTRVGLGTVSSSVTVDYLRSLDLRPLRDPGSHEDPISRDQNEHYLHALLDHEAGQYWYQAIDLYRSTHSGTSVVVPALGIRDPYILNIITLYSLSIVVRYLPDTWSKIEEGDLSHVRSLAEFYLSVFDATVLAQAYERIAGQELSIVQPGSFSAPL